MQSCIEKWVWLTSPISRIFICAFKYLERCLGLYIFLFFSLPYMIFAPCVISHFHNLYHQYFMVYYQIAKICSFTAKLKRFTLEKYLTFVFSSVKFVDFYQWSEFETRIERSYSILSYQTFKLISFFKNDICFDGFGKFIMRNYEAESNSARLYEAFIRWENLSYF